MGFRKKDDVVLALAPPPLLLVKASVGGMMIPKQTRHAKKSATLYRVAISIGAMMKFGSFFTFLDTFCLVS